MLDYMESSANILLVVTLNVTIYDVLIQFWEIIYVQHFF